MVQEASQSKVGEISLICEKLPFWVIKKNIEKSEYNRLALDRQKIIFDKQKYIWFKKKENFSKIYLNLV